MPNKKVIWQQTGFIVFTPVLRANTACNKISILVLRDTYFLLKITVKFGKNGLLGVLAADNQILYAIPWKIIWILNTMTPKISSGPPPHIVTIFLF